MKYTKLFDTHSEYETYAQSGNMIKPNVSYCVDNNDVHYNPIPYDYSKDYLTFIALEDGTFKLSKNAVSYSLDDGETWTELAAATASPMVTAGSKIMWKGTLTPTSSNGIGKFSATGSFDVQGNIMSLLYGDNYKGQTNLTGKNLAFYNLFYLNTKVVNANNLSLPATTLAGSCYNSMFMGCTRLTTAPILSATTLAGYCYYRMFRDCTSLTTTPQLPATTLASSCYSSMFYGCTNLTTATELPATIVADYCYDSMFFGCTSLTSAPSVLPAITLADRCYQYMFSDCTNLTTAPELPATTLTNHCYERMFRRCTSLTTAPELPATTLADYCCYNMFEGCTGLTTAPSVLPATTLADSCYHYMFTNCTSLITAPVLPATTLEILCYNYMFNGCTSLTTAPVLPATTLAEGCYNGMFNGCTNLNYIKAMFTTTPGTLNTSSWVNNVAATGTFVKNSAAQWDVSGVNGVPSGWTVQTASE